MYLDPNPALTAARLEEILSTIETSGSHLRQYLKKQIEDKAAGREPEPTSSLGAFPFIGDLRATEHASVLKLACERLNALVSPPELYVMEQAGSFYVSAGLRVCVVNNIPDHIARLEGPDGVGAALSDLSNATKLDIDMLGRILRLLSQKSIFQEVSPDRYRNTDATMTLVQSPGFKAYLDLVTYENPLAANHIETFMKQTYEANVNGTEGPHTPFTIYSKGPPIYEWFHLEGNESRGHNFNEAMRGMIRVECTDSLPFDYPLDASFNDRPLVDVGGGVGPLAEVLLPHYPKLKMIVQDITGVIQSCIESPTPAKKQWMEEGRLSFEVHDFFTPQREELRGSAFVLSNIIHNYRDPKALDILRTLRLSAPSKVLIIDRVTGPFYPTEATTPEGEREISRILQNELNGTNAGDIRVPVRSQVVPGIYNMIMGTVFGGKTRTMQQWTDLLTLAGFKMAKVCPLRASSGQVVFEVVML